MLKFQCPTCHAEQETAIMVPDLTRGQRVTCLRCGATLALVLGVYSKELLMKRLMKKGERDGEESKEG